MSLVRGVYLLILHCTQNHPAHHLQISMILLSLASFLGPVVGYEECQSLLRAWFTKEVSGLH